MNNEEIHNLLKIENDKTTIFTNKELKMIDDYINELEAYKYNLNRDYLRLEKENKKLENQVYKSTEYIQNHQLVFRYHTTEEIDEWFNQFYKDVLDILRGEMK